MTDIHHPLERHAFDYLLEIVAAIGFLSSFVPLFIARSLSPDTPIPTHFGIHGEMDGWGTPSDLWMLTIGATVFYVGFSVFERCYKMFNYPVKVTSQNASVLYATGVQMVRCLKAIVVIIFAYLGNVSVAFAYGYECPLNKYMMPLWLVVLLLSVLIYILKMILCGEDKGRF